MVKLGQYKLPGPGAPDWICWFPHNAWRWSIYTQHLLWHFSLGTCLTRPVVLTELLHSKTPWKGVMGGWRYGSLSGYEHLLLIHDGPQPSRTPVPGDLTPSSDFWEQQAHMWYIHINAGNTHTHKIINLKNIYILRRKGTDRLYSSEPSTT